MKMLGSALTVSWLVAGWVMQVDGAVAKKVLPPNFVMILADDLGYSDLGCYGSEIATPNLDKLAKNGLRFTQFYNTARCWPSRAALMTGYYPQAVRRDTVPGVKSGMKGVRPSWAPLFTEYLRAAGYRNYHSGKWHIDGAPLDNAFDRSFEIRGGDNNHFKPADSIKEGAPVGPSAEYYSTTAFTDHAIECLENHAKEHSNRPFFQYIAYTAPHFPLHAPEADIAKYQDAYKEGWNAIASQRHARLTAAGITRNALPVMEREVGPPYHFPQALIKLGEGEVNRPLPWNELNDRQKAFQAGKMAVHAAMVHRMDQEIGRVIAQLDAMGAIENTVIMFASDNGASAEIMVRGDGHDPAAPMGSAATFLCLGPGWSSAANTPFRRHKTWVHEGGISTPLIVQWPAGIKAAGQLRHTPTHLVDVMPTILDLAGVTKRKSSPEDVIPEAPGKSLRSVFKKDKSNFHPSLWWEHEQNKAIRIGNWKLVKAAATDWELYDLSNDRGESNNLASVKPEKMKELIQAWETEAAKQYRLAR